MSTWRARRDNNIPLELWEQVAKNIETAPVPGALPDRFDAVAEAAILSPAVRRAAEKALFAGTWRDRRDRELKSEVSLELWETLAEEFETAGEFPRALPLEFDAIAKSAVAAKTAHDENKIDDSLYLAAKRAAEKVIFKQFHLFPRTALCISGGGVRSATIGLGVLQGLAKFPGSPLSHFDFLSTVSGGGYVGGWFSAWAARVPGGSAAVVRDLAAAPSTTLEPEPTALRHIRKYCAFLNPQLGALSADTWMLIATVLRNMILNWTILIPLILASLLIPELYSAFLPPEAVWTAGRSPDLILWIGFLAGVWGAAYILWHLPAFCGPSKAGDDRFIAHALLPLTVAAILLSIHWAWQGGVHNYSARDFIMFGAAMHFSGGIIATVILILRQYFRKGQKQQAGPLVLALIAAIVSGGFAAWIVYLLSTLFSGRFGEFRNLYTLPGDPHHPGLLHCCGHDHGWVRQRGHW